MKDKSIISKDTRRGFIKKAGAAALFSAGSIHMPVGLANSFSGTIKKQLKVGLVGCGGRGTGAAVQALNADPDVILHAMADAFEDRLTSSLNLLKKAHGKRIKVDKERQFVGFDAYKKLIDSGVDVVLLASPPGFRPNHLTAAIDAGKHVFYEKPVAVDAPGVRKVLEAAKKAKNKNLSLVSGYCFRYDLQKQALYGKVLDGAIGDIKSISSTRNGGELWFKDRQPEWTDMEYQLRNWYYQNWLSGDFIVEMFVHSLDMITWALGEKMPLSVTATGGRQWRTDKKYGNIFDHFAMEYNYADDVKGYCFTRQQRGGSSKNAVEINGSLGNAYYEGNRHEITGKNSWKYDGEVNDMYQSEHDALFKSIREGSGINDGELSANSTLMGIMGRMAAYTGQTITWEDALNSTEILGPDSYDWNLKFEGPEIAVPGKTKFI
ncbi:gfo/Idh/MocA family oxidoreductase [Zobellia amurskyensis]|uniref:Gfo/Idh/MocA family oxidoreductase n=1 Tax=Zobellia amurskyensis TaxID=248905 RepID=A0A7X2ZQZ9_9FLAO|nr:Gfo/Idh/MocA family oxidoreductase [Zobellia amurskyensis]MUH34796.1 gfo/Idh/MocA family oxidoreductase [Zobellia amurskyensis]